MNRDIKNADHATFCWFLHWFCHDNPEGSGGIDADLIICIVKQPWKWQPEFEQFLDATADER